MHLKWIVQHKWMNLTEIVMFNYIILFLSTSWWGMHCQEINPDLSTPATDSTTSWDNPKMFLNQLQDIISPEGPGTALGSVSSGSCLIQLSSDPIRGHIQLAPRFTGAAALPWGFLGISTSSPSSPILPPVLMTLFFQWLPRAPCPKMRIGT